MTALPLKNYLIVLSGLSTMHKMNSKTTTGCRITETYRINQKARDAVQSGDFSTAIQATFDGLQTFSGTIQSI